MVEARLMGNREILREIRQLELAIENDFVDVSLSTLKWRQHRINELEEEAQKRGILKP